MERPKAGFRFSQKAIATSVKLAHNATTKGQPVDVEAIAKVVGLPTDRVRAKLRELELIPRTQREMLSEERKAFIDDTLKDLIATITSNSQRVLAARYARAQLWNMLPHRSTTKSIPDDGD